MRSGQGKCWVLIGLVGVLVSSSAWALDLDSEIQRQEAAISGVVPTLGHDIKPKTPDENATDTLKVQLIKPTAKRSRSS